MKASNFYRDVRERRIQSQLCKRPAEYVNWLKSKPYKVIVAMNGDWQDYKPKEKVGKLCYQYCSKQSVLPIRDVLNDHNKGFKTEPNYETATYNWCANCNQRSVRAAVKDGLSYILFITKYTGKKREYLGRYFVVGYYEIGWVTQVGTSTAIRAKKICFVPVEKAYEVTDGRWKHINTKGKTLKLENLRRATQRVKGALLNEIIGQLDLGCATDDFLYEAARLKSEYNPFDNIPGGRIFIINAGANTTSPLQSPVFDDGKFEFVPIPEYTPMNSNEILSFADLRQFNYPDKPFLALYSKVSISPDDKIHSDPEFLTFTYGDNTRQKGNLQDIREGDYLFFLARLVPLSNTQFQHEQAFFALVGYLEVAEVLNDPDSSLFTSPAYVRNAHVKRWLANPSSFDNFAIFKGSTNSRRFRFAVHFDRRFIENVPLLKVDGNMWDWARTTELGIIGSNTRTVRMYIDPKSKNGQKQAERFWHYIWEAQKWNVV